MRVKRTKAFGNLITQLKEEVIFILDKANILYKWKAINHLNMIQGSLPTNVMSEVLNISYVHFFYSCWHLLWKRVARDTSMEWTDVKELESSYHSHWFNHRLRWAKWRLPQDDAMNPYIQLYNSYNSLSFFQVEVVHTAVSLPKPSIARATSAPEITLRDIHEAIQMCVMYKHWDSICYYCLPLVKQGIKRLLLVQFMMILWHSTSLIFLFLQKVNTWLDAMESTDTTILRTLLNLMRQELTTTHVDNKPLEKEQV